MYRKTMNVAVAALVALAVACGNQVSTGPEAAPDAAFATSPAPAIRAGLISDVLQARILYRA